MSIAPPPTQNALDAAQRMRLMRSTRKLGAILGTTPHVLESSNCVYLSDSANSSVSSFASSSSHGDIPVKPKPKRVKAGCAPLYLRLNPVALTPTDIRLTPPMPEPTPSLRTPTQTPRSPTRRTSSTSTVDIGLTSSLTRRQSSSANAADSRLRRKRMAKLQRTLGENVPVELVFRPPTTKHTPPVISISRSASAKPLPLPPHTPTPTPDDKQSKTRPRSASLTSMYSQPSARPSQHHFLTDDDAKPVSLAPPDDDAASFLSLSPLTPSHPIHVHVPILPPPSPRSHARSHTIASSLATPTPPARKPTHVTSSSESYLVLKQSAPIGAVPEKPRPRGGAGRRKENDWSGEWNRADICEVINGLRGLRGR